MTDPKNQNCSNCDYARRIPLYTSTPGKAGAQQTSTQLQCRYNPPPWYTVKPEDWCHVWSDGS